MLYNGSILVIDDNIEICEIIHILLQNEGFLVRSVQDVHKGLADLITPVDLIILDVMMPQQSGFDICRAIRKLTTAPILFLTAKDRDEDKEMGFSCGGDDYLVKPFSSSELVSRAKALVRRYLVYQGKSNTNSSYKIQVGDLSVDLNEKTVFLSDQEISLTDIEYRILKLLLHNRSRILSAKEIYEYIWNEAFLPISNNTVMVHIKNLRKKIEKNEQHPKYIRTIWGKGYQID